MKRKETIAEPDVVLIGGGIMSATLGVLLHQLDPNLNIQIVEALAEVAKESSNPWNNAGTGHAALCELNYTNEKPDGSVDVSKAIEINEAFEHSRQFWTSLVENGLLSDPSAFIQSVPHMSFVRGDSDCDYLKRRHQAMHSHHFFERIEFSEEPNKIAEWAPLLQAGRKPGESMAATRSTDGTDVNFGSLTEGLMRFLDASDRVKIATHHQVRDIKRKKDGRWELTVRNLEANINRSITAPFIFVGAGGAALPLLQKSGISEGRGFGGFPVSGQFLVCSLPEVVGQHNAKVYGKAPVGAPPMSVPHLDTRIINGKRSVLFGPYAGFSPKFLKSGSLFDLPGSVRLSNLKPMLAVGKNHMDLTRYLIQQVRQRPKDRLEALRTFYPDAQLEDWKLVTAGQRVQIIKQDKERGGILQFGTELVAAEDGSIAALLGASPGASTAVATMIDVIERCFANRMDEWREKLKSLVPSYGAELAKNRASYEKLKARADQVLGLG